MLSSALLGYLIVRFSPDAYFVPLIDILDCPKFNAIMLCRPDVVYDGLCEGSIVAIDLHGTFVDSKRFRRTL